MAALLKLDIENAGAQTATHKYPVPAPTATTSEVGHLRGGGAEYLEKLGIPAGSYDLEPLDGMRRVIASRLTESARDVPHFPLNIDLRNRRAAGHAQRAELASARGRENICQ